MFEQTLENIKATIFISQEDKNILDQNGFMFDFQAGHNALTYARAVTLVNSMYGLVINVPKYQRKRFVSVINQIIFAFGPEFESRHYRKVI